MDLRYVFILSSRASLGYTIAWVLGQNILLNQFGEDFDTQRLLSDSAHLPSDSVDAIMERKTEYNSESGLNNGLMTSGGINKASNSQLSSREKSAGLETIITPYPAPTRSRLPLTNIQSNSSGSIEMEEGSMGVTVHIERAVKVDPPTKAWTNSQRRPYTSPKTPNTKPTFFNDA